MGEFVEIRTSPAEIINIARSLRDKGEALEQAAKRHDTDIAAREKRGDVFPADDEFSNQFEPQYHGATTDVTGAGSTANLALRAAAVFCGTQLKTIGDYVATAMASYDATDQQGGTDIAKAGQAG
ncbi:hypothetical protein Acy02nite_10280 [Actinoplanes cyaneus]|uniref:Uncharacterized protein n=1 Tax=Actinoplanes cyaneus TaxID=52696 RepID=A0A919ID00_9ACTN|nr:hypothetical protein [Actinoplanes cyaneus]MCW2137097.1 hypothetical protein [Actinoplanes cyaneus]GID63147.1 hypothetical protein Acy02nite_10280 [Actinoplanes cyaneus]